MSVFGEIFQENVLPMKTNVKVFVQILNMWHIVSYKHSDKPC